MWIRFSENFVCGCRNLSSRKVKRDEGQNRDGASYVNLPSQVISHVETAWCEVISR